jgi:tetratricopeptide (TPR) repeat protein
MREAGLTDSTPLTPDVARELAVRSSVRSILSGSVLPVGNGRYSIVARVTDADSGRTLLTETGAASSQDIIPVVERVARAIRRGLGEHDEAIRANKPLARVVTPSFPAYRKYVAGLEVSEQGDLAAGNRLMHEALALDSGFASAWATIAFNHLTMRSLDSAALALREALRRPDRLSDAQRYRLEAESAYALRYDIEGAIRWYDLYLEVAPRSINGHNDRGIYLYSLGRYDEALSEFSLATALQPFGPSQAQISLFNQTVTLIALGRQSDAEATARTLTGPFGAYAGQLLATAKSDWPAAEALAESSVQSPSTPTWIRMSGMTMLAGALAARGRVDAADRQLRQAMAATEGAPRRSFGHALLLLDLATDRSPGPAPAWLEADTTAGGLLAAGLWAAAAGDTVMALSRLTRLGSRGALELRRLSHGPRLLEATIEMSRGRWRDVIRILGPRAPSELDGGDPDQVSSLALRWVLADAYAHVGRADSTAALLEMVLDPARMPFNHLVLRGLVYSSASKRLALLRNQPRQSAGSSH